MPIWAKVFDTQCGGGDKCYVGGDISKFALGLGNGSWRHEPWHGLTAYLFEMLFYL